MPAFAPEQLGQGKTLASPPELLSSNVQQPQQQHPRSSSQREDKQPQHVPEPRACMQPLF